MIEKCFVIQPFDNGGPFDRRYGEVLRPAIADAGLEAYRVDQDPKVQIPIDAIETGITHCGACLADIPEDNPNVWFELGFAIALSKPVVLICNSDRKTPFPFDVQHRSIDKYKQDSPGDFENLRKKITERLTALEPGEPQEQSRAVVSPRTICQEMSQAELATLIYVMEHGGVYNCPVATYDMLEALVKQEFLSKKAIAMALTFLVTRGFLSHAEAIISSFGDTDSGYALTGEGRQWLCENEMTQNLLNDTPF